MKDISPVRTFDALSRFETDNYERIDIIQQLISVIHEGNTKQISTMTATLICLIKLIDVKKNTNEHRILYKRTWDFI